MSAPYRHHDKRTALILSGGGASGAYEVGVMRALFSGRCPSNGFRKLEPGILTGTSVGAVNASFILSAPSSDLETAVRCLHRIYLRDIAASPFGGKAGVLRIRANPLELARPARWGHFARDVAKLSEDVAVKAWNTVVSERPIEERFVDLFDLRLLVSTHALAKLVARYFNARRIADSGRELQIVATNWKDGTVRVFGSEDLISGSGVEMVLASAALPGIFSQVEIGATPYADGGIVMNSALKPAIDAGAREIHLVYVDPAVKEIPIDAEAGTVPVFARALMIELAAALNNDIEAASRVNEGLAQIGHPQDSSEQARALVHTLGRMAQGRKAEYRPITIHRYRPDESTPGTIQWLDFSRERIARMIELGYLDTVRHDCSRQGCVVAKADMGAN